MLLNCNCDTVRCSLQVIKTLTCWQVPCKIFEAIKCSDPKYEYVQEPQATSCLLSLFPSFPQLFLPSHLPGLSFHFAEVTSLIISRPSAFLQSNLLGDQWITGPVATLQHSFSGLCCFLPDSGPDGSPQYVAKDFLLLCWWYCEPIQKSTLQSLWKTTLVGWSQSHFQHSCFYSTLKGEDWTYV